MVLPESLSQLGLSSLISGVAALTQPLLGHFTPKPPPRGQGFEVQMLHPLTHLLPISTDFLLHTATDLGRSLYPDVLRCLRKACLGGLCCC